MCKDEANLVWEYFSIHSKQRLMTFNFYIIISSLLTTSLFGSLNGKAQYTKFEILLSFGLILISFIFWKIDQRNSFLIKRSETALKIVGSRGLNSNENELAKLLRREERNFRRLRSCNSFMFWNNYYSYSQCFFVIFMAFSLIGGCSLLFALINKYEKVFDGIYVGMCYC